MLTFKDYEYKQPDMQQLEASFDKLIDQFNEGKGVTEQNQVIEEINRLRSDFEGALAIVHVRHTIDTTDAFYEKANDYLDEVRPIYEGLISKYYQALIQSPFKEELKALWGEQLFRIAELQIKTFSPEVVEELQQENKLVSQYVKLRASAKIFFEGEERNLPQMGPFMESKEQAMRKAAQIAYNQFFQEHQDEFDSIYDQLVKVRTVIAKKLGFENYVELGYARMLRSDYDASMVANFRKQVLEELVPLVTRLRKRQQKRLGLETLKYYDEPLSFLTGNATPKGDPEWIIENGRKMYQELSEETHEFFNFMQEKELLDLVAKKGKAGGGYCTYINNYQSPFIFSNFNGTSGDVDVLTHEAGHAFQVYSSRNFALPEYVWPTYEACEIHSMSMEFFAWPWMENFFKEDVDKYKFSHLEGALLFIPYGVLVDEFQHWVYENPGAAPEARRAAWRELEKKYLPHRDYEENEFLEKGGYWFRQGHIFEVPFYYIDYTLAQICAFQFWVKNRENHEAAWQDYVTLCRAGGSQSFLELVKLASLRNPFEDGCISAIVTPIENWLNSIDDNQL